jgi:RNA polymerase sigma-70 factor (ECF subfamily)
MKANTGQASSSDDRRQRRLLRRIADFDCDAFDELFKLYHPRLFRFVYRMTASYRAADELANDILLIIWQSADRYRGEAKVSTWIFGIAYRQSLRHLRKRKVTMVPMSDDMAVDENSGARIEREDWVRQGINALPPKQRLTIMLVYYLGLTCEETAVATGSPVNTIKTRMFHARKKLRTYLEDEHGK